MCLTVYSSYLRPNIDEVLAKQGNEGMSTIVTQLQMWWVGPGGPRLCYLFQWLAGSPPCPCTEHCMWPPADGWAVWVLAFAGHLLKQNSGVHCQTGQKSRGQRRDSLWFHFNCKAWFVGSQYLLLLREDGLLKTSDVVQHAGGSFVVQICGKNKNEQRPSVEESGCSHKCAF